MYFIELGNQEGNAAKRVISPDIAKPPDRLDYRPSGLLISLIMPPTVAKDFFVSYNHHDRSWTEWIAWQVEATGHSVVIQAWDFRPGANFVLEMQRALTEANRLILVLSNNFLNSDFTQPEWAAAFAGDPRGSGNRLLPVRVSVT